MIDEKITLTKQLLRKKKDRTIGFAQYCHEYEILMLVTTCMQIASANFINNMIERVLILSYVWDFLLFS